MRVPAGLARTAGRRASPGGEGGASDVLPRSLAAAPRPTSESLQTSPRARSGFPEPRTPPPKSTSPDLHHGTPGHRCPARSVSSARHFQDISHHRIVVVKQDGGCHEGIPLRRAGGGGSGADMHLGAGGASGVPRRPGAQWGVFPVHPGARGMCEHFIPSCSVVTWGHVCSLPVCDPTSLITVTCPSSAKGITWHNVSVAQKVTGTCMKGLCPGITLLSL